MEFIDREKLPKFVFTPENTKHLHPLLRSDNYLTYALCLAHNKDLTEEQRNDLTAKMNACYTEEYNDFIKISNDIKEE